MSSSHVSRRYESQLRKVPCAACREAKKACVMVQGSAKWCYRCLERGVECGGPIKNLSSDVTTLLSARSPIDTNSSSQSRQVIYLPVQNSPSINTGQPHNQYLGGFGYPLNSNPMDQINFPPNNALFASHPGNTGYDMFNEQYNGQSSSQFLRFEQGGNWPGNDTGSLIPPPQYSTYLQMPNSFAPTAGKIDISAMYGAIQNEDYVNENTRFDLE